ncbi:ATP-binding protein [Bradyrhizobium japonicum]
MPGGGKLIVETGAAYLDEVYASVNDVRPGHYALIAVSDTGSGIPANMLARVFDPFFTSKGPGKGTGLGLSMVYGFIKQSTGHIKIYSEEGHGTTIKMYLPPGKTPAAVGEGVTPSTIEGGHETILVVEDDRLVRDYVLAQLHSLGYVTLQAANAAEALAIVATGKPFDLLFTDVIMPGKLNGRQLADEVSKTRPDLRVGLHLRLYRERDHPSRPAGFRRPVAGEAVSQIRSGADHSQGAEQLRNRVPDKAQRAISAFTRVFDALWPRRRAGTQNCQP